MKKYKLFLVGALLCGSAYAGYSAYEQASMTPEELFMKANIEALTRDESGYSCEASANCYYGSKVEGSVSCSGVTTCTSGYEYVTCDGRTSYCS